MIKITLTQKGNIIRAYENRKSSMAELGKKYHVTRQVYIKLQERRGVNTKREKVALICHNCGASVMRSRSQIGKSFHSFCSVKCHLSFQKRETRTKRDKNRMSLRQKDCLCLESKTCSSP